MLNKQNSSKAVQMIKENFNDNTELGKELGLYNVLLNTKFNDDKKAEFFINEVLQHRQKINNSKLRRERYNLVRVIKIKSFSKNLVSQKLSPRAEEIVVQEAWIDDQTPEDISNFVQKLREEGAYDASYQSINMKKNRIGFSIQVILPVEKKDYFRKLWFDYSKTIGVRERTQSRWILLRRSGECSTLFGKIKVKQTLKPDGSISMKPENDEILRLSLENNKSIEEIRKIVDESSCNFKAFENWK